MHGSNRISGCNARVYLLARSASCVEQAGANPVLPISYSGSKMTRQGGAVRRQSEAL
jgi:hypothetical protein